MTLETFRAKLASEDLEERAYWMARALRDEKPDDVLELVTWDEIAESWPKAAKYVGRQRPFWTWWLARMGHEVETQ